jgi:hypothetical protein
MWSIGNGPPANVKQTLSVAQAFLLAGSGTSHHDGGMLQRLTAVFLTIIGGLVLVPAARADSFAIDLKVQAGQESQSAQAEVVAIGAVFKVRKVLETKTGTPIRVNWTLSNTSSKTAMKNVLVHFFAAKEDKPGQRNIPKVTKEVAAESALTMDFSPGEKARGAVTFIIERPGFYLICLETIGAPEGEECFAALDLTVK